MQSADFRECRNFVYVLGYHRKSNERNYNNNNNNNNNNRMPTVMLNCWPNGRRRLGRHWKRLLGEAETGLLRPNL